MCNTLFCNIVKHQFTPILVSGWKHILSMMIYRNTNAVCVRVSCQNQVTVYLLAQLNTKLQGCFSSGFGYGQVGNLPSGRSCSRTTAISSMPILPKIRRTSLFPVPLSGVYTTLRLLSVTGVLLILRENTLCRYWSTSSSDMYSIIPVRRPSSRDIFFDTIKNITFCFSHIPAPLRQLPDSALAAFLVVSLINHCTPEMDRGWQ